MSRGDLGALIELGKKGKHFHVFWYIDVWGQTQRMLCDADTLKTPGGGDCPADGIIFK